MVAGVPVAAKVRVTVVLETNAGDPTMETDGVPGGVVSKSTVGGMAMAKVVLPTASRKRAYTVLVPSPAVSVKGAEAAYDCQETPAKVLSSLTCISVAPVALKVSVIAVD